MFLILYFPLLPFYSHVLIDILTYIRKIQIERKYIDKELKNHLKILDPYPFLNIGQIEHIFIDKTGTITQNDYKIKMIFFDSKLYNFNSKRFLKSIEKNQKEFLKKTLISPQKNQESNFLSSNITIQKTSHKETSHKETSPKGTLLKETSPKETPPKVFQINDYIEISEKNPLKLLKNDDIETDKQDPISDFIEIPKYTLEKYTPLKFDSKKLNIPNQLPVFLIPKFFPKELIKKQRIHFIKNMPVEGNLNEEDILKNNEETISPKKLLRPLKKTLKSSEENIYYDASISKKNSPMKISFDLSLEHIGVNRSRHLLNSSNSSLRILLLNDTNIKKYLSCSEDDFLNSLIKTSDYLDPLFEALTLCHSAKNSQKNEISCIKPEEEVILKFSSLCSHKFEKANFTDQTCEYHIRAHQRKTVFNIYNISEFSSENKNFSILYQDPKNSDQAVLLSRGSLGYIKKRLFLSTEELENLELAVKEFFLKGLIPLLYGKKIIYAQETKELLDKLNILKSSPINHSEEIKLLICEFEKDLVFIGIVGIKDKLNVGINECMTFFQEIDQRVWMVSGDSRDNCLSAALSLNFIQFNENFYEIESENKNNLILNFQNHLEDIKETFFMMNSRLNLINDPTNFYKMMTKTLDDSRAGVSYILENKYILLNGKSLDIIMKNHYLRLHFIFMVSLIKKFVCYNLSPTHKAYLVDLVQCKIINNPKVLAIGDGWNDALMLQTASIGIEYVPPQKINKKEGLINAGDIQISNLNLIKSLMLFEGIVKVSVMEKIVLYLFYKTFLIVLPLFFYNWFCNFTVSNLFSKGYIMFIDLLISLHNIVVFFLYEEPISKDFLEKYPVFYKNGNINKHQVIMRFFLGAVLESFLQSTFIFFVTFCSCVWSYGPEGKEIDLQLASSAVVLSLCIVSNLRIFMDSCNRKTKLFMILCPMAIILIFFFFYVKEICFLFVCSSNFLNMEFSDFIAETNIFVCIVGNVIFSVSSHFLMQNFLFEKYGGSLYHTFLSAHLHTKFEIMRKIKSNLPLFFFYFIL